MAIRLAKRGDVAPFLVMEVMRAASERVAEGKDVMHLEVGQPGFKAPLGARQAAARAIETEPLGYTEAFGISPLREKIASHYISSYNLKVEERRIAATTGSSGGFLLAFLACFEPGDRVALADPSYPCYRNILKAVGCEPVGIPVTAETSFQPTPEALAKMGDIAGVVVASPSNPTGSMFAPGELHRLARWCDDNGVRLISDEIYHGLTYGPKAETAAISPSAIVVNSFSKYFAMTGWRIGWSILPDDIIGPFERLAQNLFISPPTLSQIAAVAAFDCRDELERNKDVYAANRLELLDALTARGLVPAAPPDGAFYIYIDSTSLGNDSSVVCAAMLDEIGVASTPGYDFEPENGGRFIRFSFCAAQEEIQEASRRIRTWRL